MAESILQSEKKCFITGSTFNLHKHHIYGGTANRKVSDKNGFWIWLSAELHNQNSRKDVHGDFEFNRWLKEECQAKYEETHSRDEFRRLIGKSYL